ncbi:glycosyltransferase family 39 protein [Bryobacter aggregatus]|uniref:glycosyltransferase family 39 protein n=1 Tax=Bryobacter aggregatus TaxID=360054 RepID=UPI0004E200BB|nr:glycosyltransferase family 39 protein [Bryobacter aggregatus]
MRTLLILFLLLASVHISWIYTLGAEYDEALFWPATVRMVYKSPQRLLFPSGVYVAERPLPFMQAAYIGALNSYLYTLPVSLFGTTVPVFRFTNLILLAIFYALVFLLARQVGGTVVAWMVIALLSIDIELWLQSITNQGPFLLQLIATCLLLRYFLLYLETPSKRYILYMAAAMGLGLNEKLTYLWIILLFLVAAGLYYHRELFKRRLLVHLPLGVVALLVLLIPVLIYSLGRYTATQQFAGSQLAWPTDLQVILGLRLHSLFLLFDGQWTMMHRAALFPVATTPRFSPTLALLTLGLALSLWQRSRLQLFCYTIAVGLVVANLFFPEGGRLHHLILMDPLPQLAACLAIWKAIEKKHAWQYALVLLLALGAVSTGRNFYAFHVAVQRSGGSGTWSNQITKLSDWELSHPDLHFVYACWGLENPLFAKSKGAHQQREFFFPLLSDSLSPDTQAELDTLLARRDTVWVTSSIDELQTKPAQRLLQQAASKQLKPVIVQEFREGLTNRLLFTALRFHPIEPGPVHPIQLTAINPGRLEAPLAADADRFQVHLNFQGLDGKDSIHVELQSADGAVVQHHFRPLEYYALLDNRQSWIFGPHLYPDWFLTSYPNPDKVISKLVVRVESQNPQASVQAIR